MYLPLYAAGIIGPALGAVVSRAGGVDALFVVAGVIFLAGAVGIALMARTAARPATT